MICIWADGGFDVSTKTRKLWGIALLFPQASIVKGAMEQRSPIAELGCKHLRRCVCVCGWFRA